MLEQQSEEALDFVHTMTGSPYIDATVSDSRRQLIEMMQAGRIRAMVVIPVDFDRQMARPGADAPLQLITDGSEPNTANFAQGYVEGIWQIWQQQRAEDRGETFEPLIDVQMRYWFNPAAISQHFIIPGAITIIMTVVGAILTSLVVAREWERGTMEALLSTEITRAELLLCKLIPTISSACWRCCCVCWCRYLFSACPIAARCRSCLSSPVCFCSAPRDGAADLNHYPQPV